MTAYASIYSTKLEACQLLVEASERLLAVTPRATVSLPRLEELFEKSSHAIMSSKFQEDEEAVLTLQKTGDEMFRVLFIAVNNSWVDGATMNVVWAPLVGWVKTLSDADLGDLLASFVDFD